MRHKLAVEEALDRLAVRLKEAGVPYAVVGAMAMALHGHYRFTTDVDVLTTREGLDRIHEKLIGLGYLPSYPGARKSVRDTVKNVRIDFITAGEYPGDGKPKAVAFPDPADVAVEVEGINVITLPKLIELKLASGLTAAKRSKDLVDVQELINLLKPSRDLGEQLDPSVRAEYYRMWEAAQDLYDPSAG
jgi:hypothetical protein